MHGCKLLSSSFKDLHLHDILNAYLKERERHQHPDPTTSSTSSNAADMCNALTVSCQHSRGGGDPTIPTPYTTGHSLTLEGMMLPCKNQGSPACKAGIAELQNFQNAPTFCAGTPNPCAHSDCSLTSLQVEWPALVAKTLARSASNICMGMAWRFMMARSVVRTRNASSSSWHIVILWSDFTER